MQVKNVPQDEIDRRLDAILGLVGLSDCAGLYPNQDSMLQRIAVSRAFAVNPDLLLMD